MQARDTAALPTEIRAMRSFDGGERATARVARPDRYAAFSGALPLPGPPIARGSGLSYTAASFAAGGCSVEMRQFDRILALDQVTGEVEVESGITLFRLHQFLTRHGLYLPIQPGHGSISIGGCIAGDVHGKNQARDGNFNTQVSALRLFHPKHGLSTTDAITEPDVFAASCGGFGLTGIIVAAKLRTRKLPSQRVSINIILVSGPAEAAVVMRQRVMLDDMLYSWHDFSRPGGPGLVVCGRFDNETEQVRRPTHDMPLPRTLEGRLPFCLYNTASVWVLNGLYMRSNSRQKQTVVDTTQALFPAHGREMYFRGFGAKGFHEYQALVPDAAFASYVAEAQSLARRCEVTITLASAKSFGGGEGLLRFAGHGTSIALNMPRGSKSARLLPLLDSALVSHGGKPNIMKDSRLSQAVVEACYPQYDQVRRLLRTWDPDRSFESALSRRLGL